MKLSIIIPHHSETKEKIKPLMISLDQQIGIDFNDIELILCCDLDESPLDNYNFEDYPNLQNRIRKIKSPYRINPGMSRQCGLDECLGEYALFCDADDSLYNLGVLRELLENIEYSHADMYRFKFLEEIGEETSDIKTYIEKEHNWTWVFSQAYRVEFLRQHNIRFSKTLRWHEDTYFNLILRYCDPKVVDINSVAYLWKYSADTITRVDNHAYTFLSMDEFLDAVSQGFRVVLNVYQKDCFFDIMTTCVKGFLTLRNGDFLNRFSEEDIAKVEKRYYQFVKEFLPQAFTKPLQPEIKEVFTKIYFAVGTFIPDTDWYTYLLLLENKYS